MRSLHGGDTHGIFDPFGLHSGVIGEFQFRIGPGQRRIVKNFRGKDFALKAFGNHLIAQGRIDRGNEGAEDRIVERLLHRVAALGAILGLADQFRLIGKGSEPRKMRGYDQAGAAFQFHVARLNPHRRRHAAIAQQATGCRVAHRFAGRQNPKHHRHGDERKQAGQTAEQNL